MDSVQKGVCQIQSDLCWGQCRKLCCMHCHDMITSNTQQRGRPFNIAPSVWSSPQWMEAWTGSLIVDNMQSLSFKVECIWYWHSGNHICGFNEKRRRFPTNRRTAVQSCWEQGGSTFQMKRISAKQFWNVSQKKKQVTWLESCKSKFLARECGQSGKKSAGKCIESVHHPVCAETVIMVSNNLAKGSLQKERKTVLFNSIDPNVGGWGRVDPNFYNSRFYGRFNPFCWKFR